MSKTTITNPPLSKEEIETLIAKAIEQKTSSIQLAIDTLYILSDRLKIVNEGKSQKASMNNPTQNRITLEITYNSKLGNILYDLERYEEAFTAYNEIEKILKKNVKVTKAKGDCLRKLGKFQEAITEYDGGVRKWDKDASSTKEDGVAILCSRGLAYTNLENYEKALEDFNKAIGLDDKNALLWCLKGRALNSLDGKEQEALDCFNKAFEIAKAGNVATGLNNSNISFIQQTYSQDREALLNRIKGLQEISMQTQQIVNSLDKTNPAVNKAVEQFRQLKRSKTILTDVFIEGFEKKGKAEATEREQQLLEQMEEMKKNMEAMYQTLSEMKNHQNTQDKKIQKHEEVLQVAGVYDKALIKTAFSELEEKHLKLYEYNKAFYWTLLNYFSAYKTLSTGLMEGNSDLTLNRKENFIVKGVKAITSLGGNVPVVGSFISGLDSLIDGICGAVKDKRMEDRVNAINKIIMFNKDPNAQLEDDMNLCIAKASIDITNAKESEIKNPPIVNKGKIEKILDFIDEKVEDLKVKALGANITLYKSDAGATALKDVALLLAYFYQNCDEVASNRKEPLDVQIKRIVVSGRSEGLLPDAEESLRKSEASSPGKSPTKGSPTKTWPGDAKQNSEQAQPTACCGIF